MREGCSFITPLRTGSGGQAVTTIDVRRALALRRDRPQAPPHAPMPIKPQRRGLLDVRSVGAMFKRPQELMRRAWHAGPWIIRPLGSRSIGVDGKSKTPKGPGTSLALGRAVEATRRRWDRSRLNEIRPRVHTGYRHERRLFVGRSAQFRQGPFFNRQRNSCRSFGCRNPVHRENNLAHCKANRERVERACRRAFSRRLANRVSLAAVDFA